MGYYLGYTFDTAFPAIDEKSPAEREFFVVFPMLPWFLVLQDVTARP